MSDDIVKSFLDQKLRAAEAMKAFASEVEERGDGWSEEDKTKFKRISDDYDEKKSRADQIFESNVEARKADEQRKEWESIIHSEPEKPEPRNKEMTDEEKLRAFLSGDMNVRSLELGKLPSMESRVHTNVTAASGGTTVPRTFVGELYDKLYEFSPLRQVAKLYSTDGGNNLDIPTVASAGTAVIIGEGTAITGTDASFSTVTLGAWKYAKLTQVSNELIADTGVDLLGFIADDAGRAIAAAQGSDFAGGTGTNEPLGYGTAYPIGVTGATGGTGVPSVANLISLYHSVPAPYRNSSSCAWVMRDASAAYIRSVTAGASAPEQWAPSLRAGDPDTLLGKPILYDPYAAAYGTPAKSVSFGDWSSYVIRDAGSVRLERSDDFAFDKDLVTFRIVLRTDAKARDVVGANGSVKHFAGPST